MSTVISATPTLDREKYSTGDQITVTIPDASATSTNDSVQHLSLTLRSDDGTEQVFNADVPVSVVRQLTVRITAVSLDGVLGTIADDGQSANCTAA